MSNRPQSAFIPIVALSGALATWSATASLGAAEAGPSGS